MAARACAVVADVAHGELEIGGQPARMFDEAAAPFRHRQPSRAALDQANAEPVFQIVENAADAGWSAARKASRRRQTAGFGDGQKQGHFVQTVHGIFRAAEF
ncbi:MAG TPA: hypothetical protein VF194_07070 [Ferrovibrio sp.]|jgi:hypothetical protein